MGVTAADRDVHVRFRSVSKTYDGTALVVRALDLDVHRGEFLTLLGPSGSGKTTTLMMLAGFEAVSGGEILIDQAPIQHLPPHRRDIGVVFQNYALFPHMTVGENVAFPLEVRKVPKAERTTRLDAALARVRLEGLGARRPAQLSGGQQQRVALARALVFEPRLVLLDEPLGALDRQLREQMQFELKRLHADLGVTMVYVTHDQSEALAMSDRIAVFHRGAIQQVGSPEALYNRPANAFVAQFIGENNLLPVAVAEAGGADGLCIVRAAGGAPFRARAGEPLAAGQPAVLSVRPERIRLGPAAAACANRIETTVLDVTFLGDQLRVALTSGTGAALLAKVPLGQDAPSPRPGEPLAVGFAPEDAIVLAAEPPPEKS